MAASMYLLVEETHEERECHRQKTLACPSNDGGECKGLLERASVVGWLEEEETVTEVTI